MQRAWFRFVTVVVGLTSFASGGVLGQSPGWGGEDSVPLFRATAAQGLAQTKMLQSIGCLQNLRSLYIAGATYAADHNDYWPPAWVAFTNYIGEPKWLYCPADTIRLPQSDWATVDFNALSYDLVSPGARSQDQSKVVARCRVHGNFVRLDGAAQAARPYVSQWFPVAAEGGLVPPDPTAGAGREASVSRRCLNQLKQIGLAARLYAIDNQDVLPASFIELTNTLYSPAVLFCPADPFAAVPASFGEVDFDAITYAIEAPGAGIDPVRHYAQCRIHAHALNTDGSVQTGTNRYPPRLIVGHPLSQTIAPNRSGSLSVLTGDPALGPFQYQWRRVAPIDALGDPFTNTVHLDGATNKVFTIPAARLEDEGYYDVVVRDRGGGYQLSAMAYVRVEPIANVVANPGWRTNACAANLTQLFRAARLASGLSGLYPSGPYPDGLDALPPYLGWPISLYCPSDPRRVPPASWSDVAFGDTSYLLCRGVPYSATNRVLITCMVHGYQALADGGVKLSGTEPLEPRLEIRLSPTNALLSLTVHGLSGTECVIEGSSDLAHWTGVATNLLTDGAVQVTNQAWQARTGCFYRASVRR